MEPSWCNRCGNLIEGVKDAFVRITFPTSIANFHVCRDCGTELCKQCTPAYREAEAVSPNIGTAA